MTLKLVSHGKLVAGKGKLGIISGEVGSRKLPILKLAIKGMSSKEFALEIGISDQTVGTYFVNIFRKLEIESQMELHYTL